MKKENQPTQVLRMYEITERLIELEALLMESGGAMDEEQEKQFDMLTQMAEDKAGGYYRIISNFKRTAEVYEQEIKRLQKGYNAAKNGAARILSRIEEQMKIQGANELVCDIGKFKLVASGGGSLVLRDGVLVKDLPYEFIKEVDPTPRKKELMAAFKRGDETVQKLCEVIPPTQTIRMY